MTRTTLCSRPNTAIVTLPCWTYKRRRWTTQVCPKRERVKLKNTPPPPSPIKNTIKRICCVQTFMSSGDMKHSVCSVFRALVWSCVLSPGEERLFCTFIRVFCTGSSRDAFKINASSAQSRKSYNPRNKCILFTMNKFYTNRYHLYACTTLYMSNPQFSRWKSYVGATRAQHTLHESVTTESP